MSKKQNVYTAHGFVGEIRESASTKGDAKPLYFVSISIPLGQGEKKRWQNYSCLVDTSIIPNITEVFHSQDVVDGKVNHSLSKKLVKLEIHDPYMEINPSGYLNGSGVLKSYSHD